MESYRQVLKRQVQTRDLQSVMKGSYLINLLKVNFGKGTNKNTILKETRTSTLHQHRIQFSTDTHDLRQYVLVQ